MKSITASRYGPVGVVAAVALNRENMESAQSTAENTTGHSHSMASGTGIVVEISSENHG